jgi:ribosomal protein L7/L12
MIVSLIKTMLPTVVGRRRGALFRVEAKINLLLKHAGIEFDPSKSLPQEVADAIERGEKVRAIKVWREYTGAGFKEAKDFIEEVQRRSAVSGRG